MSPQQKNQRITPMYNHIYTIVEDFIKAVEQDKKYSIILENWKGRRGPKRRLSITQVIALNLLRFTIHVKDLKAFHRFDTSINLSKSKNIQS